MPVGMQVYNSSGAVTADYTDGLLKCIGTSTVSLPSGVKTGGSGTVTNSAFTKGRPYAYVYGQYNFRIDITFSGSTLSWSVPADANFDNTAVNIQIQYGVF